MKGSNSFGIKEVADVKFYKLDPEVYVTGIEYDENWQASPVWSRDPGKPEYLFDSLKVSNLEVTSEETSAKGGRGNPELISWSYGKTAILNITDALFSLDTLGLMFGMRLDGNADPLDNAFQTRDGLLFANSNNQVMIVKQSDKKSITVDAATFPSYYTIIGNSVMRRYTDGVDIPFFFYIPKAAIQVGGTLTMEAEGDPSVFEMTIKALAQDLPDHDDVLFQFYRASGEPGRISSLPLKDDGEGEAAISFNGDIRDSYGSTIPFDDSVTISSTIEFNGQRYDVPLELVEEDGE